MSDSRCKQLVDQLYELLDGEVSDERLSFLQEHLDECGACLERLGVEMHFTLMVRTRCEHQDCPEQVIMRIRTALEAEVVS